MPHKPVVMLVDDDRDLLRLLTMRLSAAGYDVRSVTSGEEALAKLPQYSPDVIVTDLQMDGMDGMTLFDHVHRTRPELRDHDPAQRDRRATDPGRSRELGVAPVVVGDLPVRGERHRPVR